MLLRSELSLITIYPQTIACASPFPHIAPMHSPVIQKRTRMPLILLTSLSLSLASPIVLAETPSRETTKAFDNYIQTAEADNNEELLAGKNFLWLDTLPASDRERTYLLLKRQQTIIRHSASCASRDRANIPGGLVHDWIGITFVPGVTLQQTLSVLQDYDRDADYYRPAV